MRTSRFPPDIDPPPACQPGAHIAHWLRPEPGPMRPDGEHASWGEVTRLLHAARGGDREAMDRIVPLVYDELRGLAGRLLRREQGACTVHPTSLVHEAYMKLANGAALA